MNINKRTEKMKKIPNKHTHTHTHTHTNKNKTFSLWVQTDGVVDDPLRDF